MHRRLVEGDFKRRFVCLTFDDGYRDTLQCAYPILKKYDVPFAIYIPTSFPDRLGELWWLALEAVIARNSRIGLADRRQGPRFDCAHGRAKSASSTTSSMAGCAASKTEDELRSVVRDLGARYGVDIAAFCDDCA